ncbi:MAG: 3-oxoacyl-[acyl-carrier-protein] synthase [Bacteroidota bacterium]|jgi:3-oxoacyl-[acyl-carrier-protein] synthase-3|nr:fabH [Methermicoccus sp.]MBZ4674901.1 fabH [Dysgonamonadaceae bacterium]MDI3505295.1 3-oxoacyl-[acyl-carrier-protein] synthase [Bacteroidota bacterium]MDK2837169.1 3-oxoacyl-[acyl-carrier-protein] synthase [Bacteroidota bacterium]MDN5305949.1 3-oxoacyl-[acyl-carrier-protein] synthase [Bacteroidota bacterium]
MEKINAVITGISACVPDYILTNDEISTMVDTNDEWITTRVGIKERRILKGENKGVSELGSPAVAELLRKTNTRAEEIDALIFATSTPDHIFPSAASIVAEANGIKNAFCFDMEAACSGFIFGLEVCNGLILSGRYKKVILLAGDKMSAITNYSDRNTCPLFGDAVGAVLIEPSSEDVGIIDAILHTDGVGYEPLQIKAGGSKFPATHETVEKKEHTVRQDGKTVFKYAVKNMADVSVEIMQKNNLSKDDVDWLVPHQANMRIIDAAIDRTGLPRDKVMINIEKYGNTSAGTIPLCLWEWEPKLKKGDNIILTAFGAGFTWGAVYLKWAYDGTSK